MSNQTITHQQAISVSNLARSEFYSNPNFRDLAARFNITDGEAIAVMATVYHRRWRFAPGDIVMMVIQRHCW